MSVPGPVRRGTVVDFDRAVGLGRVEDDQPGGGRYGFHCTQIADGSRDIAPGTSVSFVLVAARHGRTEAAQVAGIGTGTS